MHGASFKSKAAAEQFSGLVDKLGWEAATDTQVITTGKADRLSLKALHHIVTSSSSGDWHMVTPIETRAVLESNVAIAIEWHQDPEAVRNRDAGAYPCYTGLTRETHVVRVLFNGQPILQETMLTVDVSANRGRTNALFVPLAYEKRRRWKADALAFQLAKLANGLLWRDGFAEYMAAMGVASALVADRNQGHSGS